MKRYVVALCLLVLLALSGSALAAAPDAKDFSTEQETAVQWMDTLFVKNKPVDALALMGPYAQKSIDKEKFTKAETDLMQKFGACKGMRFLGWERGDKADQMVYLLAFEKEPTVQCSLIFSKKGQLENFGLSVLKPKTEQAAKEKK